MKRGLFQWSYFAIVFPVHLFVIMVTVAKLPIPISDIWRWVVMSIITYLITGLAFGVAKYFEDHLKTPIQEIGIAVIIGAIRGFAILDVSLLIGLPTVKPYILRPINSALTFPIWLLIIHFLLGTRREFRNEFHRMYVRAITSQINVTKKRSKATADELSSKIETSLQPLREQFEKVLGSKISSKELADEALIIRSFVDAEIRPLSHELWRSRKFQPPKLGFIKILSHTVRNAKLPFHLILGPLFVVSIVGLAVYYDFQTACLVAIPSLALMLIWYYIYSSLLSKTNFSVPLLNIITLILGASSGTIVIQLLTKYRDIQINAPISEFIGAVWFITFLAGITIYRGVNEYYDSIKSIMQAQIDSLVATEDKLGVRQTQREFASYLHGDVQSELLSASMQMSQAAKSGNVNLGKKALKRADEILKRDHQSYVVGSAIASQKKLERLVAAWAGIADIEFVIPNGEKLLESSLGLATDVIEDLITNAVRHGAASKIKITMGSNGDEFKLTFEDDGAAIKGRKRGLGTEMLNRHALSYQYNRTENVNRIEIELPKQL